MKQLIVAIPHSHTFLWSQTCLACLKRFPPVADGIEARIVVVDNSWDWANAARAIDETRLGDGIAIINNPKQAKFHASGLDVIVECFEFDYLMALETDVLVLRPDWLAWFLSQLREDDYAVGHWHHEQFLNPSCTLYRGEVLRNMNEWCKANTDNRCYWGEIFKHSKELDAGMLESINGPFAEKRGWPPGTRLRSGCPSGQLKGSGWYEPGQQLHHWAIELEYTYTVCPTATTEKTPGLPTQTFYGIEPENAPERDLQPEEMFGYAYAVHLWGGTRALDIIKHPVECQFVRKTSPFWQEREARFWKAIVPQDIQEETRCLFQKYGWMHKGQGTADVTERDKAAIRGVLDNYRLAGVDW